MIIWNVLQTKWCGVPDKKPVGVRGKTSFLLVGCFGADLHSGGRPRQQMVGSGVATQDSVFSVVSFRDIAHNVVVFRDMTYLWKS